MFFRTKTSGPRSYLQIVENRWEDGRPRQRVIATLDDSTPCNRVANSTPCWSRRMAGSVRPPPLRSR